MVSELAPNLSYHYWGATSKYPGQSTPSAPKVFIRGTEFDHQKKIDFEDDEGHMGTGTTKMSSYRVKADSNPKFTDKCRYGEGWEDVWYWLLGEYTKTVESNIYTYEFAINALQPKDPPFVTLTNGFAKTEHDAYVYDDCLLGELEVKFANEDAMTYTATFPSNYPLFNQQNPARSFPAKTYFVKPADVSVHIAPPGVTMTEENMEDYKYGCYIEGSFSVNNNVENQSCSDDDFGESTKLIGEREAEFNLTLPWTSKTKGLEYVFMGGSENATKVTSDNDVRTVWIKAVSSIIPVTGNTTVKYTTIIKIPEIVLQAVDSPQSGTDAKQLELKGKIQENGVESFIQTKIITDLDIEDHIEEEPKP